MRQGGGTCCYLKGAWELTQVRSDWAVALAACEITAGAHQHECDEPRKGSGAVRPRAGAKGGLGRCGGLRRQPQVGHDILKRNLQAWCGRPSAVTAPSRRGRLVAALRGTWMHTSLPQLRLPLPLHAAIIPAIKLHK